jgi:beta-galactosidase
MSFYPKNRVTFAKGGIVVGGELIPLYSGSVHYWRLEREAWRAALVETKKLGFRFVDTYVPWGVHETAPGQADFGEIDPQLDVDAFLRMIHELGLYAIVRPGPHINAELTFFGIPERIVWDPACQARSPQDNAVMLPMVPVGFPVPSYASEAFLTEAEKWFAIVGPRLARFRYPEGPIVLCQVDNEGTLYFRDGLYDQDYRPEAIALYRTFLREKYVSRAALDRAYGKRSAPFEEMNPPVIFDGTNADELTWHLDWAEFQEHLVSTSLARMRAALAKNGMVGIPTFHNMTMGYEATPLSAARIRRAVDLVGLDYYHRATPTERLLIERRTTELATRSEGLEQPAFACEMAGGVPPFYFPTHDEADNRFNVMASLAYGLRAFNLYMAVERDRWVGAPIDRHGRRRPFAAFWTKLVGALDDVKFHELSRVTQVRIVNSVLKRRLNRALHAFSPATPALFAVLGSGSHESCFEDDFGLGGAVAAEVDAFIECFEAALSARGVPFAHVDEGTAETSLAGARWIICPTAGGVDPDVWRELRMAASHGAKVTVGPRIPSRDGSLRVLDEPLEKGDFQVIEASLRHPFFERKIVDGVVARMIDDLSLVTWKTSSDQISVTAHEDDAGRVRALFLINPTMEAERATIDLGFSARATDLLDGTHHECREHRLTLSVSPRTVRLLKIDLV